MTTTSSSQAYRSARRIKALQQQLTFEEGSQSINHSSLSVRLHFVRIASLTIKDFHPSFPGYVTLSSGNIASNRMTSQMMYPTFVFELPHTCVYPPLSISFRTLGRTHKSSRETCATFTPRCETFFVLCIPPWSGSDLFAFLVVLILQSPVDKSNR
jgi:hypothetical protein